MYPTMLRDSQTHHECLMEIYNMLNTTPTENLNHDYLQQLFQRHIERMKYKERLNNEMVHTEIKKDESPMYVEAQAKWEDTMKERLQGLSDVLGYPTTRLPSEDSSRSPTHEEHLLIEATSDGNASTDPLFDRPRSASWPKELPMDCVQQTCHQANLSPIVTVWSGMLCCGSRGSTSNPASIHPIAEPSAVETRRSAAEEGFERIAQRTKSDQPMLNPGFGLFQRENSVEKYSILALWDKHCELDINSIGHFISAEELRPLIKPLQKLRPSLNIDELLEYFRPLLSATILDETEEQVLTSCDYGRVRRLLQTRGCSNENRLRLWSLVLGLSSSPDNEIRYEYVRRLVLNYDCLIDKFLFKDIRTRASNDDQFFVFEDEIFQILLAFQRETLSDNLTSLSSSMIVPSIVLAAPSALVAPVCFVTSSIADVFHIFSTLAKRYFTYLTRLTSNANGIVNIFHVFNSILSLLKPKLFEHLLPITVEEEILDVLLSAFAGPLAADQVLVLWDAMIGFDSTLVLALLAAGVVLTRQDALEACENRSQLRDALQNLRDVQVMPTLKFVLGQLEMLGSSLNSALLDSS